jgi:hypothetical protein
MTIPSNERCIDVITALVDEPNLSAWEHDFVSSNLDRTIFTDRQKEVIANLEEKYEIP